MKRTALSKTGKSETAKCKVRIQALLRQIAIKRDGGCFLRLYPDSGLCGPYKADGNLILQFDHLNSRVHSVSYGDSRLGVCVCQRHHFYWKKQYSFKYETYARNFIGPNRTKLLEMVQLDKKSHPMGLWDWQKVELSLQKELEQLSKIE